MSENIRGPDLSRRAAIRTGRAILVSSAVGAATSAYGADKANPKVVQYRAQPKMGQNAATALILNHPVHAKQPLVQLAPTDGVCSSRTGEGSTFPSPSPEPAVRI
jgi:hypothetical protein